MSFNGFALAGSYPYEMTANESRIVENIQYLGKQSPVTSTFFSRVVWSDPLESIAARRATTVRSHDAALLGPATSNPGVPAIRC